jgi:hypothetical protein
MNMVDLVTRWIVVIARERERDGAGAVGWSASDNSKVSLCDTSLFKGDAERCACLRAPGEDEKARRVAIKTMHRFETAERRCESHGHGGRVERGAGRHARHPGGFVDDHDPIVGEHDPWRRQCLSFGDL